MKPAPRYCAIYTRKSTEEGLEQDFNSLDAQREACLSYIASQKSEGWVPVLEAYDDGGYSGGNLERPALKRLIEDIKAKKINTVVVYKIDRLTRALMDFSKLVEVFDQYGVTFVSITQSFNTTTSMGRLTLNVLLSFAQFEREVIGERVRDKVAASKVKGMWMGGTVPLGYSVENRQLIPNEPEAQTIRHIFERYLEIKNVNYLQQELAHDNICSKVRIFKDGRLAGGRPFSRGALRALLANPIYVGQIRHKDKIYPGQHLPILPIDTWQRVQDTLHSQASIELGTKQAAQINVLKGLIFDESGVPYSPGYSHNGKRQYRYYISQNAIQQKPHPSTLPKRFSAYEIENLIERTIRQHLGQRELLLSLLGLDEIESLNLVQAMLDYQKSVSFSDLAAQAIRRIVVVDGALRLSLSLSGLVKLFSKHTATISNLVNLDGIDAVIDIPYTAWRHKKGSVILQPKTTSHDFFDQPSEKLKKLVQGIIWRDEHFNGSPLKDIAHKENCSEAYVGTAIFMSFEALSKVLPV